MPTSPDAAAARPRLLQGEMAAGSALRLPPLCSHRPELSGLERICPSSISKVFTGWLPGWESVRPRLLLLIIIRQVLEGFFVVVLPHWLISLLEETELVKLHSVVLETAWGVLWRIRQQRKAKC